MHTRTAVSVLKYYSPSRIDVEAYMKNSMIPFLKKTGIRRSAYLEGEIFNACGETGKYSHCRRIQPPV